MNEQLKELVITLVGGVNTGKTVFLTSMIHQLASKDFVRLTGINTSINLGEVRNTFIEVLKEEEEMFSKNYFPPATGGWFVNYYLQIAIVDLMKNYFAPYLPLLINDSSGELILMNDNSNTVLADSNVLFIFVDPTEIRDFNPECIERTIDAIRATRQMSRNRKIDDMDVAVILTKMDRYLDKYGQGLGNWECIFDEDERYVGCFDLYKKGYDTRKAKIISKSVSDFISEQAGQIYFLLIDSFVEKNIQYFATSSIGFEKGSIKPANVTDPLMWVLAKKGIIKKF